MNILITSASRDVTLIRAFQQALAQEGGGRVIAVDINPLTPALYFADEHYLVPPSHEPEFLTVMLRLCEQQEVKLLISSRDEDLPLLAEHKERFASIGTTVIVPDPTILKVCQDKRLFIQFCQENGFVTPRSYEDSNMVTHVEFPLFVKPRYGKGGQQTFTANSAEELALILKPMPDAVVQEFIKAPEYSVDLFADFAGRVISVVPRERIRTVGGESYIGRTSRNAVIIQEAARLAEKLKLVGHNTIQCFYDNNSVTFIEVNPRFGGGAHLGFAAGAPTPLFLVKLLKGESIQPKIGDFRDNYIMLRYTEDMFLDEVALSNRRIP